MEKNIRTSFYLDSNTFVVEFNDILTKDEPYDDGDTEFVSVEFHKDENRWVAYKTYCDKDGYYIDSSFDILSDEEKREYLKIAKEEYNRNK